MTKAFLAFCFFLSALTGGWAQTQPAPESETLFQGDLEHSFYIAPSVLLTHWQERSGLMVGGKVAWVLNRRLAVGLAGYGLVSKNNIGEVMQYSNNVFLQAGYGGLLLEYIPTPSNLMHFSFPVIMGMGGAAYTNDALGNNTSGSYSYEVYETDRFLVVEPGVQAEINMAKFMRLGLGVSYRLVQGVDLVKSKDKDLSAPAISLTFKFGRF